LAERMRGFFTDMFAMFGRVPFAFYVAHFYLLHALCLVLGAIQGVPAKQLMTFPPFFPKGYGLPLWGVYLVWVFVIAILYPFCQWLAGVKARSCSWWLSYV